MRGRLLGWANSFRRKAARNMTFMSLWLIAIKAIEQSSSDSIRQSIDHPINQSISRFKLNAYLYGQGKERVQDKSVVQQAIRVDYSQIHNMTRTKFATGIWRQNERLKKWIIYSKLLRFTKSEPIRRSPCEECMTRWENVLVRLIWSWRNLCAGNISHE